MAEGEEAFDVTIKGQISGYGVATLNRVLKIEKEFQKQEKQMKELSKKVDEQKKLLNVLISRIDRLESFLSSYVKT